MTAPDLKAEFADLVRTVIPPAYGADFVGMDALCNLLAEREAKTRADVQAQLTALLPCGNGCVLAAVALSEQVWTGEEPTR